MTEEQLDVMKLREALAEIVGIAQDHDFSGALFDITPNIKLGKIERLAQKALNGK